MEFQYHPASGRRTVIAFSLGERGERFLLLAVAVATVLALSLWFTAPAVVLRAIRRERSESQARALAVARASDGQARRRLSALAARELQWGDDLNKIGFLYGVAPAQWPRALDPARALLASADALHLADGIPIYLRALERGREILERVEAQDPGLAARSPSIAPIADAIYEPAVFFGPRVSPWTGEEEFFCGLDLAAPEGSAVIAPAGGRVVFVGRARRERQPRLWQFGSLVVIEHGPQAATLFGHLSRIDVRRGERVVRGQRLGAVGKTGWALSPRLHYELWKPQQSVWRPTDPLFAILERRLDARHRSLEQMLATSAPEPADELPGLR